MPAYRHKAQVIELPIRDGNTDYLNKQHIFFHVIELPIRDGN